MSLNNQNSDMSQQRVAESNAMSSDVQPSYELVHLMTDYASRYGYLLGGLEMVAAGQTSADKVLESYKQKYETTPSPDAARPTSLQTVRQVAAAEASAARQRLGNDGTGLSGPCGRQRTDKPHRLPAWAAFRKKKWVPFLKCH